MKAYKTDILNYCFIMVGSLIMAFGVVAFLSPNHIATGGTAGLAIVLHSVINLPIGVLMALINVPLLLVSLKYLGKTFAIKTIVCIAFIVVFVDVLAQWAHVPNLSNNPMLATLYGGVIIGAGLGLIFKGGASAGGGTILAKIIAANSGMKTSNVILLLDALVVASAGLVFKSVELALWSLISIYVASKVIDIILVGAQNQKIVHLSSSKNLTELSQLIATNMGISGTLVKGNDLGETEYKDIIFLMIDKNRLNALKQLVLTYDANVKMIVMEATEVLGSR
ncbi:MAG TPA: YitT family protein [Bacteroidia bacterium]